MPKKPKKNEPERDESKLTDEEAIARLFPKPVVDAVRQRIAPKDAEDDDDEE